MNQCVFCAIVADEAPASVVYRDERVMAFMVLRPMTPGHLVVIPVKHATTLGEMDVRTGSHVFSVAMQMAAAIRRAQVRCEGINLFLADGAAAGQTVFHVHLHVFPRFAGDGFRTTFDTAHEVSRTELDHMAALIRQAL